MPSAGIVVVRGSGASIMPYVKSRRLAGRQGRGNSSSAAGSRRLRLLRCELRLRGRRSGRGYAGPAAAARPHGRCRSGSVVIRIKPGVHRQVAVIVVGVVYASSPCNESWTAAESPTVSVLAPDFIAKRLTFQNTFGASGPAVAMRVAGDKGRVLRLQDTLLDDTGRHYYRGCYIEGGTDFVFGNARALFDKCHLHSTSLVGGAFTAHKRSAESEDTGFSFVGCKLTGVGKGTSILGRPWGPYSRVVLALSYMSSTVRPEGWDDWSDPAKQRTAFYGQYQCYGEGSKADGRVAWSRDLSQAEAARFITKVWVGGQEWLR
ncbi:putative pectinesterase 11 [Panicum miliaceum]|uniref:pectinesterase n=1 Tax=Panicum miliaceum TaxID=4540 RepID=A0A3L6SQ35_PANMI|nr:putative pectinesterase 11 [Panicum miliaceum]